MTMTIRASLLACLVLLVPMQVDADDKARPYSKQAYVLHICQSLRFLAQSDVQQELGIPTNQRGTIKTMADQAKKDFAELNTNSRSKRERLVDELWYPAAKKYDLQLGELLNTAQRKELSRRVYQNQSSPATLLYEPVIEQLDLNEEQVKKIGEIYAEAHNALDQSSGSRLSLWRVHRVAVRGRKEAIALLNPGQLKKWNGLLGNR